MMTFTNFIKRETLFTTGLDQVIEFTVEYKKLNESELALEAERYNATTTRPVDVAIARYLNVL